MYRQIIYPGFVRLSRVSRRAGRRSSERGQLIQTAAVISAALGIDTDLTLSYQLFALLLCLIVISRISLRFGKPDVSIKRRLPRYATANETFSYYLDVENLGTNVEKDLRLVDKPTIKAPTHSEFQNAREPGEETRNAYDRYIGFHRFVWLQRKMTGIKIEETVVDDINVKSKNSVKVSATPLRRGFVTFNSTIVQHPDPFGLNYGQTEFKNPEQLLVLPERYHIPASFEIPSGRHFQPGGTSATWSIGESDEFASLRDYRDGDSLRRIHWASSAKRSKPVVKEFQDEYFVRQALVLDTEASPDLLDGAVSVAASFALRMRDSEALLDLMYLSHEVEIITTGHGLAGVGLQLEALACLTATPQPIDMLSNALVTRASTLSGCILVFTSLDDDRIDLIETLRTMGVALEVFLVAETISNKVPDYVRQLARNHIAQGLSALK